ncbi:uncharacterized protein LOC110981955 isoform X2 [Acanthaster planci]|uniref:Uncharacterized protein LOC110981955 isoform X2 n=1 Tax=Acanthaster planci TaxID=133434 RepID=A0A8B7YR04_ACAPL|nr:uncharacterized protein LOC110981955 isoform X2 [Acanthaster planci]
MLSNRVYLPRRLQVLEETGIWSQVKRLAGSSAGAVTAGLLAVGYNSHDLEALFNHPDLERIFLDARFGLFSLFPNMRKRFGWHPGNKLYSWFGKMLYKKTGNADITFEQVYTMYGKELCICVTNINFLDCFYCHVKTTPDMPIRMAMRMSGSIPGVFCTVKNSLSSFPDHYVDGGLLVNYPIHAFDGWYLSMRPEDTFLKRVQPLRDIRKLWDRKERFRHKNERTLGLLLYSDFEPEVMKDALNKRHSYYQDYVQATPNTKLAKKRMKKAKSNYIETQHNILMEAMDKLLAELNKQDVNMDGNIQLDEWMKAFNSKDSEFTDEYKKILFDEDGSDPEKIFNKLDFDQNGEISYRELLYWAEKRGLKLLSAFRGYERREIKSMTEFFSTLMECLLLNMKRVFIQICAVFLTTSLLREIQRQCHRGMFVTVPVRQERVHCIVVWESVKFSSTKGASVAKNITLSLDSAPGSWSTADNDLFRTVGIDCRYLDAMDFNMDTDDKRFLIEQGKLGCMAYLREFVDKFKPPPRRKKLMSQDSKKLDPVTLKVTRLLNSESDAEGLASPMPPTTAVPEDAPDDIFGREMQEVSMKVDKPSSPACNKHVKITLPDMPEDDHDSSRSVASCEDTQLVIGANAAP